MFHVEQMPFEEWLAHQMKALDFGMQRLGIALTPTKRAQFSTYLSLLWQEGQKYNLFSKGDLNRLASRHLLESVGWVFRLGVQPAGSCLDIGTGAGFPGIPLKILFPEMELVLVESIAKKANFLNLATRELHLKNVAVWCERVEVLAKDPTFWGRFDLGTARAVASLNKLVRWSHRLFKHGAHLFVIKGGDLSQELQEVQPFVESKKIRLKLHDYFINFISDREQFVRRKIIEIEFRKE